MAAYTEDAAELEALYPGAPTCTACTTTSTTRMMENNKQTKRLRPLLRGSGDQLGQSPAASAPLTRARAMARAAANASASASGKGPGAGAGAGAAGEADAEALLREKRRLNARAFWMAHLGGLAFVAVMLGVNGYLYGWHFVLPGFLMRLRLDDAAVGAVVASHTVVHVGGPHRGGTTFLWGALAKHAGVSGFEGNVGRGLESEGMFVQDTYPTFGIGTDIHYMGGEQDTVDRGVGRFAFDPDSHLTETSEAYLGAAARTRLYNRWGVYWDTSRRVLLEKSPPNMQWSRYLQALWDSGPLAAGVPHADVRFVFVTRHPVAVAMATRKWECCDQMRVVDLVRHWVVQHRWMEEDKQHLRAVKVVHYEDVVREPVHWLREILAFVGLDAADKGYLDWVERETRPDTNHKHHAAYCALRIKEPLYEAQHTRMVEDYGDAVEQFGYQLDVDCGGGNGVEGSFRADQARGAHAGAHTDASEPGGGAEL